MRETPADWDDHPLDPILCYTIGIQLKGKSMTKSEGLYPDAHPTAPGGMSRLALAEELVKVHGWEGDVKKIAATHWPTLIERVAQERKAREAERWDEIIDPAPEPQPMFLPDPHTKDFIFDGHAGAGPSGAERWMNCTASLEMTREFLETLTPNQQAEFAQSSMAARQGTTAHIVAEAEASLMLGLIDQAECDATLQEMMINPATEDEAYSEEMAEYITEYVDLVRQYHDDGHVVMLEARVSAAVPLMTVDADGDPDVYEIKGSADFIALPNEIDSTLTVGDLKYGEGLDVDVHSNPQIRIYALGALAELVNDEGELVVAVDRIQYYIIQPRLGGIKEWSESVDDLLTWRDDVLSPALTEALAGRRGGAALTPGELQCQWCPVRGACPALAEKRMSDAVELFDVIVDAEAGGSEFPETALLDDDLLGRLYAQVSGLTKIKDDLKAEVQRRLYRGSAVPGFQLVNYTPPRKWKAGAEEELDDRAVLWSKKLLTPTQAVKILGEEAGQIADLIESPDIRPVVAPEGDRRKTWGGLPPEQMFEVE